MPISRRGFLAAATSATLIFCSPALAEDDSPVAGKQPRAGVEGKSPAWLRAALAEMKATGSVGIAVAIPDEGFSRDMTRMALQTLLTTKDDYELRELLVEAVYVAIEGKHGAFGQAENLLLLSHEGKRLGGGQSQGFAPDAFKPAVSKLLRGGGRLAARAKASATPEVTQALKDLAGEDADKRAAASMFLLADFAKYRASVIHARVRTEQARKAGGDIDEFEKRLRLIVDAYFEQVSKAKTKSGDAVLPFGAKWSDDDRLQSFYCPPCGMGHIPKTSKGFLDLLVKRRDGR